MNFFSVSTFKNLWREEPTFKHEVYATVVLLPLAWLWLGLPLEWRIGLTAAWAFVMVVEALNRALCAVIDAIFIDNVAIRVRAGDDDAAELPDLFDRVDCHVAGTRHHAFAALEIHALGSEHARDEIGCPEPGGFGPGP